MTTPPWLLSLQNSVGSYLPSLLGGLAVLLIGWLVALALAAGTRKGLAALGLNVRLNTATPEARDFDYEKIASRLVFWFVLLLAVLGMFSVFNVDGVSGPLSVLAGTVMAYLPRILLALGLALLLDDNLRSQTLKQLRLVAALVLLPEAAAACLMAAYAATARRVPEGLELARGQQRRLLEPAELQAGKPWRLPLPCAGLTLQPAGSAALELGFSDGRSLIQALAAAPEQPVFVQARQAFQPGRLGAPLLKFVLLPLLLALPAFHLHQHIAYGSALGEFYSYGFKAYALALALWWAAWAVGVLVTAAALRLVIEASALLGALWHPAQALALRSAFERLGLGLLYLGLPAWLGWRLLVA